MKSNIYADIRQMWKSVAPEYWWGDPLDVRFYLCEQLTKLRNKKVLDVGCNVGIITHFMHSSNTIVGIDLNNAALEKARKLNPGATYKKQDMFKAHTIFKEKFDVIILSHILPKDNFPSDKFPEELLDVILPLLAKNGELYLSTPSVERCYNRKNKFINRAYLEHLLQRYKLNYEIYNWCPWPQSLNHMLQLVPGIWKVLKRCSKTNKRSVAFYVKAKR